MRTGFIIARKYEIQSSHALPYMPEGHKCRRMHGHNFKFTVELLGFPNRGIVMDYGELDQVVRDFLEKWDHQTLNDFVTNPTSENLAEALWDHLREQTWPQSVSVYAVTCCEDDNSSARIGVIA